MIGANVDFIVGEKVKIGKRERREEEGEWTRRRRGTDAKKNGREHI